MKDVLVSVSINEGSATNVFAVAARKPRRKHLTWAGLIATGTSLVALCSHSGYHMLNETNDAFASTSKTTDNAITIAFKSTKALHRSNAELVTLQIKLSNETKLAVVYVSEIMKLSDQLNRKGDEMIALAIMKHTYQMEARRDQHFAELYQSTLSGQKHLVIQMANIKASLKTKSADLTKANSVITQLGYAVEEKRSTISSLNSQLELSKADKEVAIHNELAAEQNTRVALDKESLAEAREASAEAKVASANAQIAAIRTEATRAVAEAEDKFKRANVISNGAGSGNLSISTTIAIGANVKGVSGNSNEISHVRDTTERQIDDGQNSSATH